MPLETRLRCSVALIAFSAELGLIINGVSIDIVHPATAGMENNELERLITELHGVACDAFGKHISYEAIAERTYDMDYIFILRDGHEKAVGYASNEILNLDGREVNYFASAMVRKEYQGKGIYSHLKRIRVDAVHTDVIMTRTQNPKVYRSFSNICNDFGYLLYPNGSGQSEEAISIAKSYCPETDGSLIVRNAYYGESLMKKTPEPEGMHEQKVFSGIDIEAGDALMLVGLKK